MLRSPIRAALLCGLVAMLVIAGLTTLVISELHLRDSRAARGKLAAFATLLAEQTARSIESVDLVVGQVAEDLRQRGITTAASLDALRDDPDTFERLRRRAANLPQLEAITLDSNRGRLINMSRYIPVPDVDITDRDYFRLLSQNTAPLTTVSAPVQNRGSGTWNIYLARRLNDENGGFIGLALGAMRLDYFEQLYEAISLADNIAIALWRDDGTLLARFPHGPLLGRRTRPNDDLRLLAPGATAVHADARDADGQSHLVALRRLPRPGLVIEVSQNMADVFADWRGDSLIVGLAGAACMGAAILLMLALVRQFRAYDAMYAALAAREEAVQARRRAEERLLEAQTMEAIGRLTSGIAHDFNNLLSSVSGNVEMLLREPGCGPSATRRLSVIQLAADRGAALVRQMLAFSRQQVLTPSAVALDVAFSGMAALLEGTLGQQVQLCTNVDPLTWPVMVDPAQFEYMVLNLAVNARDAMPEGGILSITARNVTASAPVRPPGLPKGDFVAIAITDTGTGMAEETLRKAFDPFFTTKPPGRGSGLGLSQVYGLATQSGGTAQLESRPGTGTTVTVLLPRADCAPRAALEQPETELRIAGD